MTVSKTRGVLENVQREIDRIAAGGPPVVTVAAVPV